MSFSLFNDYFNSETISDEPDLFLVIVPFGFALFETVPYFILSPGHEFSMYCRYNFYI